MLKIFTSFRRSSVGNSKGAAPDPFEGTPMVATAFSDPVVDRAIESLETMQPRTREVKPDLNV